MFYRDGVGDGQFDEVLEREIKGEHGVLQAFRDVLGFSPQLVFIVCQMRTRARFAKGGGRENVAAGTVVDAGVVGHGVFDFYGIWQKALKGTARPSHYHVLWDDAGLSADQLQRFTFDLAHLYPIATKLVSRPAPVYLAHRAAFLAPYYEAKWKDESGFFDDTASVSSGSGAGKPCEAGAVGEALKGTVYYA